MFVICFRCLVFGCWFSLFDSRCLIACVCFWLLVVVSDVWLLLPTVCFSFCFFWFLVFVCFCVLVFDFRCLMFASDRAGGGRSGAGDGVGFCESGVAERLPPSS